MCLPAWDFAFWARFLYQGARTHCSATVSEVALLGSSELASGGAADGCDAGVVEGSVCEDANEDGLMSNALASDMVTADIENMAAKLKQKAFRGSGLRFVSDPKSLILGIIVRKCFTPVFDLMYLLLGISADKWEKEQQARATHSGRRFYRVLLAAHGVFGARRVDTFGVNSSRCGCLVEPLCYFTTCSNTG